MKKAGQKTVGVQLRPLAQLEYKEIDVDYLYISAYKGRDILHSLIKFF